MNGNAELLNFVYQNSEMGVDTITQILKMTENERLKEQLTDQLEEYKAFKKEARGLLEKHGFDEKGINSFDKMKTYLMINMQTLTDKSVSHIAEMMMIGSNMGIIDSVKKLKQYQDAESGVRKLMERLQKKEEQNLEKMKEFL